MSLQTDIVAALTDLGIDTVWPQAVPEDVDPPFVVYRVLNKNPETTLDGSAADVNYIVSFECYSGTHPGALALAAEVDTLIKASSMTYYETNSPGEEYIPLIDGFMEPVYFGIWST